MIEITNHTNHLSTYVDSLQKQGHITFRLNEAASVSGISLQKARLSAYRLSQKNRIFRAYRNFYVIVPLEYQNTGCPPPDWFIAPLMHHMGTDYYVGLLSAAALHGAAHQQPMIFQVLTAKYSKLILAPSMNIQLYRNNPIYHPGIEQKKTVAGYINVSTPELTAFDLIRYAKASGHYNHIATVLAELAEKIDARKLAFTVEALCQEQRAWIYVQRLGYLLDVVGFEKFADPLAALIRKCNPKFGYLVAGKPTKKLETQQRWHLYINDTIEADL
ncbi:MAG: type IV toxin-antitoxin system AbiEi family antitoxin [Alphaproteobacteria bacterium]